MPIPLVALDVKQPESPLDQYAKGVQLKSLLQGQQLQQQQLVGAQQENQMRQQQMQDQQASTAALKSWDGKSLDDLPGLLLKHGGSATAVFGMKQQILDQKTKLSTLAKTDAETGTKNFELQQSKNDALLGRLQAATTGDDAGLPQRLTQAAQQAAQEGLIDPQHAQTVQQMVSQTQDPKALRNQLGLMEKGLMGQKEQFAQVQKERETQAKEQEAQARVQGSQTAAAKFGAEMPGGPLYKPTETELEVKAQQGDPQAKATIARINANKLGLATAEGKARAATTLQVQQSLLTPEAQAAAGQMYATTGQLPAGIRSPAMAAQIINKGVAGQPGVDLAANKANYGADTGSLKKLQTNFDQVSAFEGTALKNLDLYVQKAKAIPDLGTRFANIPLRMITGKMIGDENLASLNAARQTASSEVAKVLGSANASGVLSDSQKKEASDVLDGNLPLKATIAVANTLKQDFANRHVSYAKQIADIQNRIGGKQGQADSTPTATKSISMAAIQQAAKDHGVSVDEATKQAKAAGYNVQ